MVKVAFSVDDFSPVVGYGKLLDNGPLKYLKELNEEFGCKFTLFCIPKLDGDPKNSWDNNRDWVEQVKQLDFVEIAQHGFIHKAQKPEWGAQEFIGLEPEEQQKRIRAGYDVFRRLGIEISGFKAPGWYITPEMYEILEQEGFDYVADHFIGNKIIKQNNIYRVPYTFTINKCYHLEYDDYLILHSHISPQDGSLNGFSQKMYDIISAYLRKLHEKYETVEYITFKELVEEQK